ncbi:MAG: iron-containing alcohol dehydrogenase [Sphingobacteriaceae bacterium]
MENFERYNPTKIIFGKNVIDHICDELAPVGKRALIVIGKDSVKRSGLYARLTSLLNICGIEHCTYEGIKSNPVYQDADAAVQQAKDFKVDMIIALGGGSVIDTAKAVALGYYVEHSVWDFYLQQAKPEKALPLFSILTLAATGTEMNPFSVLQDTENGSKRGYTSALMFPKVSYLDPSFTTTVPADYTAYGVVDLIAHCLEQFFGSGDSPLTDLHTAAVIRLAIEYGLKVKDDPENYEHRANIMWLATNALNGSLTAGKNGGDWACHGLEHSLSVLFDIAHGAGLSIVFPAWLKHHQVVAESKLAYLAKHVFDLDSGNKTKDAAAFISQLEVFFSKINAPVRLKEAHILPESRSKILENFKLNKVNGMVYRLDERDYEAILDNMW